MEGNNDNTSESSHPFTKTKKKAQIKEDKVGIKFVFNIISL